MKILAIEIGEKVPDFYVPSTKRRNLALSEYEGDKNVLLVFFPLAFTPG